MDNLYKTIRINNDIYTIILENNHGITCISDTNLIRKNFKTEYDLNKFIETHKISAI